MRPSGRAPHQLREVTLEPGCAPAGRRLVPDPLRQHPRALHRDRAGARAAVPAQHRPRLGHRRVRHAAARHRHARTDREAARGRQSGRTQEIQRLIGARAARGHRARRRWASARSCSTATCCRPTAAPAPPRSPAPTSRCTRRSPGWSRPASCRALPLREPFAAVSCGLVEGQAVLDLDYAEDSAAEADANFVLTGSGAIVEIQVTAESDAAHR